MRKKRNHNSAVNVVVVLFLVTSGFSDGVDPVVSVLGGGDVEEELGSIGGFEFEDVLAAFVVVGWAHGRVLHVQRRRHR